MKEMLGVKFYKAWFYGSPVWVGDPYGDCALVPRHIGILTLWLSECIAWASCRAGEMFFPDREPMFCIKITDKEWKG